MAAINGHFDLASRLLARGATSTWQQRGRDTLYGVLNMQWGAKARTRSPSLHATDDRLSRPRRGAARGCAGSNARLRKSLWYTTYNRDLLSVDRTGATPFWWAAYTLDVPAMKLLLKYGADPRRHRQVPERYEEGGPEPKWARTLRSSAIPFVRTAVAQDSCCVGRRYWYRVRRQYASARAGRLAAAVKFLVEELGADVNAKDHNGYTPLHHAASRGDNELIRISCPKARMLKAVAAAVQTTVDMANGPVQRVQPFPETIALLESLGAKNITTV